MSVMSLLSAFALAMGDLIGYIRVAFPFEGGRDSLNLTSRLCIIKHTGPGGYNSSCAFSLPRTVLKWSHVWIHCRACQERVSCTVYVLYAFVKSPPRFADSKGDGLPNNELADIDNRPPRVLFETPPESRSGAAVG